MLSESDLDRTDVPRVQAATALLASTDVTTAGTRPPTSGRSASTLAPADGAPSPEAMRRSGLAVPVAGVVLQQRLAERRVGGVLEPTVDGRPDLVPGGVGVFPVRLLHVRAHHLRDVGRLDLDGESVHLRGHRCVARGVVLVLLDVAELQHAPQHVAPAHHRLLRVGNGVEPGRRLGQTRDHGDLGERELRDRVPVVDLRRGPDPVGALAEEDLVDVQLQDLLLAELALDLQCEEDLVELADVGLLSGEEEVPGHLHGDGAAPRPLLPGADEVEYGAGQALPVDPGVLEEPVVLAREECLDEPLRAPRRGAAASGASRRTPR